MSFVDLNKNQEKAREVETLATVANGLAIASAAISELIGKDLAKSEEVSFEDLIVVCVGNEINTAIERMAGEKA
jgi:hypothetical protein